MGTRPSLPHAKGNRFEPIHLGLEYRVQGLGCTHKEFGGPSNRTHRITRRDLYSYAEKQEYAWNKGARVCVYIHTYLYGCRM